MCQLLPRLLFRPTCMISWKNSPIQPCRKSKGFTSETEKEVFEIQLVQLQEQYKLESAMIEKDQMCAVLEYSSQMNALNFHKNMCNEQ